jgi:alpha-ketoglutarate-dependent taurine dioxygenase
MMLHLFLLLSIHYVYLFVIKANKIRSDKSYNSERNIINLHNIKQIPNSFCAEILNYDLEYATYNDYLIFNQYLLQYKILIFRNQSSLTIEKQREFSLYFGKLQSHIETTSHHPNYNDVNIISNIKKDDGQPIGLYVNVDKYHTDYSWSDILTLCLYSYQ